MRLSVAGDIPASAASCRCVLPATFIAWMMMLATSSLRSSSTPSGDASSSQTILTMSKRSSAFMSGTPIELVLLLILAVSNLGDSIAI